MAAKVPVVSTTVGAEGLDVHPPRDIRIADTPQQFAAGCLELLESADARAQIAERAWSMVCSNFSSQHVADCFSDTSSGRSRFLSSPRPVPGGGAVVVTPRSSAATKPAARAPPAPTGRTVRVSRERIRASVAARGEAGRSRFGAPLVPQAGRGGACDAIHPGRASGAPPVPQAGRGGACDAIHPGRVRCAAGAAGEARRCMRCDSSGSRSARRWCRRRGAAVHAMRFIRSRSVRRRCRRRGAAVHALRSSGSRSVRRRCRRRGAAVHAMRVVRVAFGAPLAPQARRGGACDAIHPGRVRCAAGAAGEARRVHAMRFIRVAFGAPPVPQARRGGASDAIHPGRVRCAAGAAGGAPAVQAMRFIRVAFGAPLAPQAGRGGACDAIHRRCTTPGGQGLQPRLCRPALARPWPDLRRFRLPPCFPQAEIFTEMRRHPARKPLIQSASEGGIRLRNSYCKKTRSNCGPERLGR